MTIKKLLIILCLIFLLCAAKRAYDEHFGPARALSHQQEEAAKLKQLENDLHRAAAIGRGDYRNTNSAGTNNIKTVRSRRTGST